MLNFELRSRLKTLHFRHFLQYTQVVQDTIWGFITVAQPALKHLPVEFLFQWVQIPVIDISGLPFTNELYCLAHEAPSKVDDHNPNYFQPEEIAQIWEALESEPIKWKMTLVFSDRMLPDQTKELLAEYHRWYFCLKFSQHC